MGGVTRGDFEGKSRLNLSSRTLFEEGKAIIIVARMS